VLTSLKPVTPQVIERFEKEAKRVTGVIDSHLKKTGQEYLVGDKATYADISFIPWYRAFMAFAMPDWKYEDEFPYFTAWLNRLLERPAVQKIYARKEFQKH
jgi:glutathione S-transferase